MLHYEPAEEQLYWHGKALYSAREPRNSAIRKLPQNWEEACLYVLPGPGLGYGLAEILAQLPATSRLLLLEWDRELAKFSHNFLEQHNLLHDPRVQFLALQDDSEDLEPEGISAADSLTPAFERLHRLLQPDSDRKTEGAWRHWAFRRVRVLSLNRSFALQKGYFQPLLDWLEAYVQNFWQNRLTLDRLGPLWLRNFFRNLEQLPNCLPTQLQASAIVLAAAGPSLEWHYQWLQKERRNYTLLAVDTALLPLLKAGIVPDYVINLDAQVLNLLDFYDAQSYLEQQPYPLCQIADLSCDPRSFSIFRQPFQLTVTQFAPMRLWQRFAGLQQHLQSITGGQLCLPLEPLGSVGVSSLAIALHCQPEFVLFVGYDFAYPMDLHHVRGTSIQQKLLQGNHRLSPANSFAGSLSRPLLNKSESIQLGLQAGFVTDQVLHRYAVQLQNYLRRNGNVRSGRLTGLINLAAIPELSHEKASAAIHSAVAGNNTARRPEGLNMAAPAVRTLVLEFWHREWEILQDLQAAILSGELQQRGEAWWRSHNHAADYLLRLCLPKAGYTDAQTSNWPRLLQLSQDFSTLLAALLQKPLRE